MKATCACVTAAHESYTSDKTPPAIAMMNTADPWE